MKTTKQVIDESGIDPTLVRAVVRAIGEKSSLQDVYNHGADAGYCGFTYTRDTVAFYRRHRIAINDMIERMADDLGENPADMVAGFNCLGKQDKKAQREYLPSASRCIYGGRLQDEDYNVANALAWFALEEVARAFCDLTAPGRA